MDGMENMQAAPAPSLGEPALEPVDLAQAFKMLNRSNRETAEDPVGEGAVGGEGADEDAGRDGAGLEAPQDDGQGAPAAAVQGDGGSLGGSAVGIDAVDFDARKQQLLRNVQQQAVTKMRKEFADKNIGYYSVGELTVRDEKTGRVKFRNPDVMDERDPDYWFSSRDKCQSFCNSWNQDVDNEFRKAVNEEVNKGVEELAPVIRLIDFIPKYEAMDDVTRKVFDSLIEPYTIYDSSGNEVGFNVNLDAAARQASAIADQFRPQQQASQQPMQEPAAAAGKSPALDMPSGHGKGADDKEPANIGEALKMYDKKNRSAK